MNIALLSVWLSTVLVHLGIPLLYLAGMRRVYERRSDEQAGSGVMNQPTVTILVPTYNEASVVERKIQNLSQVHYPRDKIELIVIDGGSTDSTPDLARSVIKTTGLQGVVIEEGGRKGKAAGLNQGLKIATGDLVCMSDAECEWERNALSNAVRHLSDPSVGSVSGVHQIQNPEETLATRVEESYRSVYRILRLAESKLDSTPVAEGELQLFRRSDLEGFDPNIGGDDTDAALSIVSKGLRAISAEDVIFYEPTPRTWKGRFRQKIRRGQHVLQAFLKHRKLLFSNKSPFSRIIFPMEFFLFVVNPVLFLPSIVLTILVLSDVPVLLIPSAIGLGIVFLIPGLRQAGITFATNNLTMLGAIFQEARGARQLQWTKIDETRRDSRAKSGTPLR